MSHLSVDTFPFLIALKENNQREWFQENKAWFQKIQVENHDFFQSIGNQMGEFDEIESVKPFRIYRDVRFSKDKSPYKNHFSCRFYRAGVYKRGTYYLHLEPNNSFCAGGFYGPNKEDLYRIRKEFEIDDSEIREILAQKQMQLHFPNGIAGNELKTAPRDFDKNHSAIDLIRKKQFYLMKNFTNNEILSPDFPSQLCVSFKAMLPFLNYMSEIVTTNLNGEPNV